jgi:hypothetical protein
VPIESGARRWAGLVWAVFAGFVAMVVIAASFSVAWLHAQHAIDCINATNAARGEAAQVVGKAFVEWNQADAAYNQAERTLAHFALAGRTPPARVTADFLSKLDAKATKSADLAAALNGQMQAQKEHPVGKC